MIKSILSFSDYFTSNRNTNITAVTCVIHSPHNPYLYFYNDMGILAMWSRQQTLTIIGNLSNSRIMGLVQSWQDARFDRRRERSTNQSKLSSEMFRLCPMNDVPRNTILRRRIGSRKRRRCRTDRSSLRGLNDDRGTRIPSPVRRRTWRVPYASSGLTVPAIPFRSRVIVRD